jgi:hypothetical protein
MQPHKWRIDGDFAKDPAYALTLVLARIFDRLSDRLFDRLLSGPLV